MYIYIWYIIYIWSSMILIKKSSKCAALQGWRRDSLGSLLRDGQLWREPPGTLEVFGVRSPGVVTKRESEANTGCVLMLYWYSHRGTHSQISRKPIYVYVCVCVCVTFSKTVPAHTLRTHSLRLGWLGIIEASQSLHPPQVVRLDRIFWVSFK